MQDGIYPLKQMNRIALDRSQRRSALQADGIENLKAFAGVGGQFQPSALPLFLLGLFRLRA